MLSPSREAKPTISHSFKHYRLFGVTLASDFPFANRLAPGTGIPDLTFTCGTTPPFRYNWKETIPIHTSPYQTEDGESVMVLYRAQGCDVLHFTGVADFYLWPHRIVCHTLDPTRDYMVEIRLLGPVFSLWLEHRNVPTLHASAVTLNRRAVAFLSTNRGGKTSLAAALMQLGHPLLTDDILPVEQIDEGFLGRPGYPTMRMWPDEAQHFVGGYHGLEQVHPDLAKRRVPVGRAGFGSFCAIPKPLACCYLPERREPAERSTEIKIAPVSPRDAVMQLIRNSFAARMVEAAGLAPQRLNLFVSMARQVPMRRLTYPSGFEHLAQVRLAILDDLKALV
jgi:hypothetical protein